MNYSDIKTGDTITFNWWNNWQEQAAGKTPHTATRKADVTNGRVYAVVNGYTLEIGSDNVTDHLSINQS